MTGAAPEAGQGPRGRRPGPTETRAAILDAARALFGDKGYDGASVRAVARAAGVDPALVHHFYGGKQGLFVAAMRFPVDPAEVLARFATADRAAFPETMARTFLEFWDDPDRRAPILALFRSAMTNERAAAMMREFVTAALLERVAEGQGVPLERVQAAAAQLVGMAVLRYVLRVEPMASLGRDELVALLAPALRAHFG
ncbi:TetR/AcrR family transcriptional regulator [Actinomadura parmotrematis]|uniref:TetR family transcriptional regulator n=1 Tax=Actinomadura parmotrematis TaxID=2864039 RepID=A0ABS7FXI8_9ACTN|nr:TetR family transcriptional regulator [Actinomadura parmotrematis]MBW8485011.1 TetR family transcriptional regulator [Actinomadura parmotrematis]